MSLVLAAVQSGGEAVPWKRGQTRDIQDSHTHRRTQGIIIIIIFIR